MNIEQTERGEYNKFYVERRDGRDGRNGDRRGADYLVLDLTYDKYAYIGLAAYAYAVEAEYPLFAADLFKKLYHPNFPFIFKACFAVTQDNGGLNRDRDINQIREEYADFLVTFEARYPNFKLDDINKFFKSLSDEDLSTAAAGEESEMIAVMSRGPLGSDVLLTEWFEEHC